MSVAHVASSVTGLGVNGGTTGSLDSTGANFGVGLIAYSNPSTPVLSDSKGNTPTMLTASEASYAGHKIGYFENPTVGSSHTGTIGGVSTFATLGFGWFSGVATSSSFDQENGATSSSLTSIQPGSVTPSEDNELVVTACTCIGTANFAINGGFTSMGSVPISGGAYFGSIAAYLIQTTAAAANPTMSWDTSGNNAARIATFRQAAVATRLPRPLAIMQAVHRASSY